MGRTDKVVEGASNNTVAPSGEEWKSRLEDAGYLPDTDIATMVYLAVQLRRPLLIEGPAGVGKTSLGQRIAVALGRRLVRLQCFEGMDATHALYDWNYHKQLAALSQGSDAQVFTEEYLLARPLMQALMSEEGAVLLIDEVDRADEAFEALLLEFLAEFQITVPEWRTVQAKVHPVVVLTSNRTRALSDALRRRCLYLHIGWPSREREARIVTLHTPEMAEEDVSTIVRATRLLRSWDLIKAPGIAETLDWAKAFMVEARDGWSLSFLQRTLGCVVKDAIDLDFVRGRLEELQAAPDT